MAALQIGPQACRLAVSDRSPLVVQPSIAVVPKMDGEMLTFELTSMTDLILWVSIAQLAEASKILEATAINLTLEL